jgi:hypothetical protein
MSKQLVLLGKQQDVMARVYIGIRRPEFWYYFGL